MVSADCKRERRERAGLLPPLLVAFPAIVSVWGAVVRASWASLGRDQGIFQYVAWAVRHGDVAYRDVRDVNGPVITIIHTLFQILGGTDEHRFRVLDLLCTGLSYAVAGALVPDLFDRARAGRAALEVRLAWALAAWVVFMAHYTAYGFWDTAQRESFLCWFVLLSVALQAALADPARSARSARALVAAGFLSFVPWLGKPTFALFTGAQLLALALEGPPRLRGEGNEGAMRLRARRLALFAGGGIVGLALPVAFVAVRGDLAAWARITFVDVPAMYRFIWHRPAGAIFSLPGYATLVRLTVFTTVGLVGLVVWRKLPVRALPIALMPALGLVSVAVQAKGFPYHFHPVTLGLAYGLLVGVAAVWKHARGCRVERPRVGLALRIACAAAAVLLGARAGYLAWVAPFPLAPPSDARDRASLESRSRLAAFDRIDYFPAAMREAAAFVASHTRPDERVQTYGMDAYLLFLAERRSATPYIYAYDLNADAAMHGSFDDGGLTPDADEVARIRAMRDEHEKDLLARIQHAPPAAFVFVDRSPLMSSESALEDFWTHCPSAAAWVSARYRPAADFDGIRVWLPEAR